MLGRLIAAAIFIGCVALFVLGSTQAHLRTGHHLLQALGFSEGYERVNAVNRDPGYTQRERRETGANQEASG